MGDTPSLTRGVRRRDPRGDNGTAGLERHVVQDSQEEERLFQAMERAGPRREGTEEPGLWEGEL